VVKGVFKVAIKGVKKIIESLSAADDQTAKVQTEARFKTGAEDGWYLCPELLFRGDYSEYYSVTDHEEQMLKRISDSLLHKKDDSKERNAEIRAFIESLAGHKSIPGCYFPQKPVFDETTGDFVGYLMEHPVKALDSLSTLLNNGIDRKFILKVCLELCNSVALLHKNGILVYDYNPDFIFYTPEGEIAWINTELFIYPDGKHLKLRAIDKEYEAPELNENAAPSVHSSLFSLAVTLFRLMNGGAYPFKKPEDIPYGINCLQEYQPELTKLFSAVFDYDSDSAKSKSVIENRPDALTWAKAFEERLMLYEVYTDDNKAVTLGDKLLSLPDGDIYRNGNDDNSAVKVYSFDADVANRSAEGYPEEAKIAGMIKAKSPLPSDSSIWWPSEIVRCNGAFCGYIMLSGAFDATLAEIINNEKTCIFEKGYNNRTAAVIAYNLLKVVEKIHEANIAIGEINTNEIVISKKARIGFAGADHFSTERVDETAVAEDDAKLIAVIKLLLQNAKKKTGVSFNENLQKLLGEVSDDSDLGPLQGLEAESEETESKAEAVSERVDIQKWYAALEAEINAVKA